MKKVDKLYRCEMYYPYDSINRASINVVEYPVIKTTPKGYWIQISVRKKKWTSNVATNRFAHANKEQALKHFIRRKTYRNICIEREIDNNYKVIRQAKQLLDDTKGKK